MHRGAQGCVSKHWKFFAFLQLISSQILRDRECFGEGIRGKLVTPINFCCRCSDPCLPLASSTFSCFEMNKLLKIIILSRDPYAAMSKNFHPVITCICFQSGVVLFLSLPR